MARLVTYSVDAFGRAQTKSLLAEVCLISALHFSSFMALADS
jgi:hypothetical protein